MSKRDEATPAFALTRTASGRTLGSFPALDALPGLVHAVSTKQGGLFPANQDDPQGDALAAELAAELGLREVACMRQVHGNRVLLAEGGGLLGEADALATAQPGLALLARGADCPLIFMAGPRENRAADKGSAEAQSAADASPPSPDGSIGTGLALGLAHASWRGTVAGVGPRLAEILVARFQVQPARLLAAISPSAGPCCYEVGEEVRQAALKQLGRQAAAYFIRRGEQLCFDLWSANVGELVRMGLSPRNIHVAGRCTLCEGELFPSYRREGKAAGRFVALLGIAPDGSGPQSDRIQ